VNVLRYRGEVGWRLWLCWVLAIVLGATAGRAFDWKYYDFFSYYLVGLDYWEFTSGAVLAGIITSQ
jgi:hypothetical protein